MLIKSPARNLSGLAVVTMAALFAAQLCQSKPVSIGQTSVADETDPMLAMPSGQRQQVIYVEQPQPQPPQEVHYVYANAAGAGQPTTTTTTTSVEASPEPATQEVPLPHYQPEQAGYQIQYVSRPPLEAPYQVIQVQAEPQQQVPSHEGLDCNQRHEYASVGESTASLGPSRGEYPGEILYIGHNSELLGPVGGSDGARPGGLSSELAQSSGLPATILTEIPIKDMPLEVLEKLKKEYGVKVVATRERPGANLVINCDDYANQENSICQRQQAQHLFAADQPAHEAPVYPQANPHHLYTVDDDHHHHDHHQQQPQHQHQYQIHYRSPQRHQSRARINHDDVHPHPHPHGHQDDLGVLLEPPARGQAYPLAANYSVGVVEHHSRPVEYVSAEPELTSTTSAAANAEATGNDHSYGSRTTVSADEQPEYVARTPLQSADDGPTSTTTAAVGQTEANQSQSDTTSPAGGPPTEAAIASPEDESRHEGFEEQPPKSNAEDQDNSKSPAVYIDRH